MRILCQFAGTFNHNRKRGKWVERQIMALTQTDRDLRLFIRLLPVYFVLV